MAVQAPTSNGAANPMAVFAPLRSPDVRSLAGPVLEVSLPAGARIVSEGQVAGTFFVIRSGTAAVRRAGRLLATLGPGDCFGEIDAVPAGAQRCTVTAATPVRLLAFSALGIARLCAAMPGARSRILASLPTGR